MDAMSNFKLYILFCLLECVMVVLSVDPHSQIKGKFYVMQWVVLAWGILTNYISEENMKFDLVYVFAVFRYCNSSTFHYIISVESISAFSQTWLQPICWNRLNYMFYSLWNLIIDFFYCARNNWVKAQVLNLWILFIDWLIG